MSVSLIEPTISIVPQFLLTESFQAVYTLTAPPKLFFFGIDFQVNSERDVEMQIHIDGSHDVFPTPLELKLIKDMQLQWDRHYASGFSRHASSKFSWKPCNPIAFDSSLEIQFRKKPGSGGTKRFTRGLALSGVQ